MTAAETSAVIKFESMSEVKGGGVDEDANANNTKPMDVQVSINNDLKVTKSITRALPVVTTNSVNGIKEVSILNNANGCELFLLKFNIIHGSCSPLVVYDNVTAIREISLKGDVLK